MCLKGTLPHWMVLPHFYFVIRFNSFNFQHVFAINIHLEFLYPLVSSHPGHKCDQIRGPHIPSESLSLVGSCDSHRVSFVCDSPSQKHLHGCEPWGYDIPTADAWLASSRCFKQHISNFLSNMLNQEMKTTTCDLRSTGRDPSIQPTSLEISWCSAVLRLPHCHPPSHCEVCRTEHLTEYVVLNVEAVQKSEAAWHAEKRAACTEYTFECCCFVGSGKAESAT